MDLTSLLVLSERPRSVSCRGAAVVSTTTWSLDHSVAMSLHAVLLPDMEA